MSRLDDHVAAVQNRFAMQTFFAALGWTCTIFAAGVLIAVVIERIFMISPQRPMIWLYAGAGLAIVAALAYAIYRRPGAREAAVPIDQKLGLKEKISTALYMRNSNDPFAQAAVRDAEASAREVALNLGQHFPLHFPRSFYTTIAVALVALMTYAWFHPGQEARAAQAKQIAAEKAKVETARESVKKALATVSAMPPAVAETEAVKIAKADLQAMLDKPITDPEKTKRTAVQALDQLNQAVAQQIKENAKYAQAQNQMKMFRSMQKPIEGQGPVADAHRAIVDGKFEDAVNELSKAVDNFDKLDKAEQKKAADQMQQLAQQLQAMANDPAQQDKVQQQLQQQLGMNQQQAKQAQQLMQQAAQGDKQAQQQLQQMAQQVQQQMNNGQGPNPQQQQQIQQMMNQMQAQANAQQQAQQMQQAAQQMAQAMQQAAQQAGQQQQAQQPGQQPGQQQNQQMQQAMGQMQQQMQNMQAAAQDAQQIAAAQAAGQQAAQAAQQAMGDGGQGGKPGNGQGQWGGNGDIRAQNNQPQQPFNRQGAPAGPNQGGIGAGDRSYKQQAPYGVKQEIDPSQDDEKGKILASNFIKDKQNPKGVSTEAVREVFERAMAEQTDEIEQERVSRQAQRAVRDYFSSTTPDEAAD